MWKIFFSVVLLSVVSVSLGDVKVSTKLTELNNSSKVLKPSLSGDDGYSNWGDLVYQKRQTGDLLLYRDLIVHPDVSGNDQTWTYRVTFGSHVTISSVRFINVGRQRAFAGEIDVGTDRVQVIYIVPALKDPRVFVEIYGYHQ